MDVFNIEVGKRELQYLITGIEHGINALDEIRDGAKYDIANIDTNPEVCSGTTTKETLLEECEETILWTTNEIGDLKILRDKYNNLYFSK